MSLKVAPHHSETRAVYRSVHSGGITMECNYTGIYLRSSHSVGLTVTKDIVPPPKSVRPDQSVLQPKLVHLVNFSPSSENINSKQFKVAIGI